MVAGNLGYTILLGGGMGSALALLVASLNGVTELFLVGLAVGIQYYHARYFDLLLPVAFVVGGTVASGIAETSPVSPIVSVIGAGLLTAIAGALVGRLLFARDSGGGGARQALLLRGLGLQIAAMAAYSIFLDLGPRSIAPRLAGDSVDSMAGSLRFGLLGGALASAFGVLFRVAVRSRWGISIRAVAEDRRRAESFGVNSNAVLMANAGLAYLAVGLAGGLRAGFSAVSPWNGWPPVLLGAMAAVAAQSLGLGRLAVFATGLGCMIGGLQLIIDPLGAQALVAILLVGVLALRSRRRLS